MAIAAPTKLAETNPTDWLESFTKALGSGNQVTSNTVNTSAGASASIEQLLATLTGQAGSGDYSKDAAFRDSDAILAQIFNDFKTQALPQIFQQQAGTGGYNSSTGQLLANDAFSRTVAAGQAAKLQAAKDYAAVQTGQSNAAVNAAAVAKGVNPSTTQQVKQSTASKIGTYGTLAAKAAPYALGKNNPIQKIKDFVWDTQRAGPNEAYSSLVGPSAGTDPISALTNFGTPGDIGGSGVDFSSMIFDNAAGPVNFAGDGNLFNLASAADFSGAESLAGSFASGAESFAGDAAGTVLEGGTSPFFDLGLEGAEAGFSGVDAFTGEVPIIGPLISIAQGNYESAAGTIIGSIVGGPFGAIAGGFLGSLFSDSVICKELHRQKLISDSLRRGSAYYAMRRWTEREMDGYRLWARPTVHLMQKSPLFTKVISFLFIPWVLRANNKHNLLGSAIHYFWVYPVSQICARFIPKTESNMKLSYG